MENFYPPMINALPEADIPFEGVSGRLFQGADHQIVFFEIEPIGEVAPHSHGAQWGVVFDGEMELTINGVTSTYRNGDRYYIPEGVVHAARFNRKTRLMDFFADVNRYRAR